MKLLAARLLQGYALVVGFILVLALGIANAQAVSQRAALGYPEAHLASSNELASQINRVPESAPLELATAESPNILHMPVIYAYPTPTITPSPTPTIPPEPPWLTYLNRFRTDTGLSPLVEIESWTYGGWLHGRYMVKNDYVGHHEDAGNPWYTPEGDEAASSGNVYVSWYANADDERPIDFWMTAPFHAISMLDPQLHSTGFGIYRENIGNWKTGATLDVIRGRGALPPGTTFPIPYPADGSVTWLAAYYGGEFPDPLTSCPGYSPPTGPPLMLQLGGGELTPQVVGHRLLDGGNQLPSCIYDETNYVNPDSSMQWTGRIVLNNRDAVVVMPRDPLTPGKSYTVEITTSEGTFSWSFTVSPDASRDFNSFPIGAQIASVPPQ